jgi:hypothetical protein
VNEETYCINVFADDAASAGRYAQALADSLREASGVINIERRKLDSETMDLGTVLIAVASSGSAVTLAHGLAGWLRARKGAKITIERNAKSGNLKVEVANIDAESAVRITEIVQG